MLVLGVESGWAGETLPDEATLTTAAQIRSLKLDEAESGRAVHLEGVVSLYRPGWQLLFLQDASGGVYLFSPTEVPNLAEGDWIRVDGVSALGGNAVIVANPQITKMTAPPGDLASIRPWNASLDSIERGELDAQWLQFTGQVRRVSGKNANWSLQLGGRQIPVTVLVPFGRKGIEMQHFDRALVEVKGVCTVQTDEKKRPKSVTIYCRSADDVHLLAEPVSGPFENSVHSIRECLLHASHSKTEPWVQIKGVVTYCWKSQGYVLQDATGVISIEPVDHLGLVVGDCVEAAGFLFPGKRMPALRFARLRNIGHGVPVEPVPMNSKASLSEGSVGRLVAVQGFLVKHEAQGGKQSLTLDTFDDIIVAELPEMKVAAALGPILPGLRLRLTGIWMGKDEQAQSAPHVLLLRSLGDIEVLGLPNWWTPRRVLAGAGAVSAFILSLAFWVFTLQRQVRFKTDQVRLRLEREAALEMKFRNLVDNARDLVCTLDANGCLTSLNLAGERMLGALRARLIGIPLANLASSESRVRLADFLGSSLKDKETAFREVEIQAWNGECRVVELSLWPDGEGGLQGIGRDVTERKKAAEHLSQLHQQVVEASRRAGMAEVATGVLHNVGNVLNSVNVSVDLITERIRGLKTDSLERVCKLLDEHRHALGAFFADDPKGKHVPDFLRQLGQHLESEKSALIHETGSLAQNVGHIKEIVAMQQTYARASGVVEDLSVSILLEDALRLVSISLARQGIMVERHYDEVPLVRVDKHKVLQILVNLVRNAKQALRDVDQPRKVIVARVFRAKHGPVAVELQDNGIGISAENLVRIFSHGFTTKKDGHGFGLHSSALAAREMGGFLRAQSEGPQKGATFTLELPIADELGHSICPDNSNDSKKEFSLLALDI